MKKSNVVIILVIVCILFNAKVYGTSSDVELGNFYDTLKESANQMFSAIRLENMNMFSFFQQPLNLFWIFIKAFAIVILINIIAKLICGLFFNSSSIIVRRIKTRKLDKVLKKIYPKNKSIYS